ncbi:MAG TPA: hypothetical protein VMG41_12835 [Gemmatimonadales bacterium]|nr:hypothetical protein [Gemmatimonadales bacterium]
MRRWVALSLFLGACTSSKVEPGLVGTWEIMVPNQEGVARWVWEIHNDGTYAFHAEGPGGVPAHSGTLEARRGRYRLQSTTLAWADSGTYHLVHGDTLTATGRLGTGSWHRVETAPPPDQTATVPAHPGIFAASDIVAYLRQHPIDPSVVAPPSKALNTQAVQPDPEASRDGVIGDIETGIQNPASPGEIAFKVYRDRKAAEAAYAADAVFDAPTFRSRPGEYVSSHAYTYRERGEARCLSRNMVNVSQDASVTCYLLVQYPTAEPVIIVSTSGEHISGKTHEASAKAIDRADDLLFAGLKQWEATWHALAPGR